ncbi:hypothetical protein N657DRAFT_649156 [Parathielavia appendiculata]|uniref:Nicotinamide-nucleotide adenylyltransferase n=1 Tax=Parathielavia appendiculata TaxID=2587402 RepID=A0AAN6TTE5_9PEZI|nr:hypothetical protein N657DRAFT_649156 [Parathielavia appendiculata]
MEDVNDLMGSPNDFPRSGHSSMPPQAPASSTTRSIADFFTRALSSFQSSGSKFSIVCTAPPALCRGGHDDGQLPAPLPPRARPRTLIVLDSSFNPPTRAHLRMATSAVHDILTRKQGREGVSGLRLLLLLSVNNADKAVKPAPFDQRMVMMWAFAGDLQRALVSSQCQHEVTESVLSSEGNEDGQKGQKANRTETETETETLSVDLGLTTVPYFHEKSAALAELAFYNSDNGKSDRDADGVVEGNTETETEQVFLVGFDTMIRIFNPKYYGPSPDSAGQVEAITPMHRALGPFFFRAKLRVTMRTDDEWGGAEEQTAYLEGLLGAEGLKRVGGSRDWGDRIEMVGGRKVGADVISSTYARAAAKERDWDRLDLMVPPEVGWWIEQEGLYAE